MTEHDVTYDISTGSDFITNVQDSYSEEYKPPHEQSDAHNRDNEFITPPGTEVTWYDESGHINLFNAPWFARTHGVGADGTWGWSDIKYDLPTFTQDLPKILMRLLSLIIHACQVIGVSMNLNIITETLTETLI